MTGLFPQTLFTGKPHIRLGEVASTNTFALELVREKHVTEGTAVSARAQVKGRGQRGNNWESEPGKNISVSVILRPAFLEARLQFDLTRAVALAVSDLLKERLPGVPVQIKWPNDIIASGKKIAGILIENIVNGTQLSVSVAGIGINVNQVRFSNELPHAVSLAQLSGNETDVNEMTEQLFAFLEARYLQLRGNKTDQLREEYLSRLFRKGETARYSDLKEEFEAVLESVTPEGLLQLKDAGNTLRVFRFKEVQLLT